MRAFLRDGRSAAYEEGHDDLRRRRHLAAQPLPALRLRLAARADAGGARAARRRAPSCASSAGATSTTRCSPPTRPSRSATTARAATAGRARSAPWRPGGRAGTGYPLVDAGMRQLRRRGLHAQPGPDDRRLLPRPRTSTSTGAPAPGTSGTCSATARSPTTPATGSGSPAPATTPAQPGPQPVRQAERFDPDGHYVRRYVPELAGARQGDLPPLADGRLRPPRLPGPDRRPRRGRRRVHAALTSVRA